MRGMLLVLLLVLPAAAASQEQPVPMDPAVITGTLPNGLRYYVRENHRPENRAELRLVVNAGSILEEEDQLGLAHFVEHMAFNGTKHFAGQELVDILEGAGMRFGPHLNAYTGFDETVYMLRVPSDSAELLGTGLQILEDWAHGITFDTTEIRKERGVVIEEWRGGRGAGARLADQIYPVLFRESRYAQRLPIGTRESLESFEPEVLRRFYREWYRPDLMAVIAVGDFDAAEVERLIRTHFERIPARRNDPPRPDHSVPRRDSAAAAIATDTEATGTQVQLVFFQPASERGTVAAFRTSLVSSLYSRMLNARLSEIARTADAPFLRATAGTGRLVRGTDQFSLGAVVADTGVERGLAAVLTEVERVERHGFTEAELERTKRSLLRAYQRQHEERENIESARLAGRYVQHFLSDQPIPSTAARLELVERLLPQIGLGDVNGIAAEWLRVEDRAVVVRAPEKPEVQLPEGGALLALLESVRESEIAAYEETVSDAPLVAAGLKGAAIVDEVRDSILNTTTWTLENGVRVILKPTDFKADEVLFRAYSPGGTSLVPDTMLTSAQVATEVVSAGGLGEFTAVDLQKKLAGIVAGAGVTLGTHHEGLSGGASSADLQTLFELIHLRFTAPRADTAAFQALLSGARSSLANRSASPAAAFQDTMNAILTQHHPRSRPFTVARVDSIDLAEAMAVYRDRFADASDFTFVFAGSFDIDSMRPLVQRYLGNLPSLDRREEPRDVGSPPPSGIVEREVRKGIEPRSRAQLVFSGPFEYTPEERFAIARLADVLEIRLREKLREELGGTYGVGVGANPRGEPQLHYTFSISFGASPDRVDELIAEVFAEVESLRRDGATEQELMKVREMRLRDRETALRQNNFWVSLLYTAARRGEDPHEALDLRSRLDTLTRDGVRRAAVKYLDPQRYVRVTLMPEDQEAADTASGAAPSASLGPTRQRRPSRDRGWAGAVDLGFTASSGNSQFVALTTGASVRHLRTKVFKFDWSVKFRYGESGGEVAARHFQTRLNFDLGPAARVAPFVSLTGDRDQFRRQALRTKGGTGVRYGFYRGEEGEASLRAAVLYSHERFTPEADRAPRSDGGWSFKVSGKQRLGETIRLENASSYEPVMDDFGDYDLDVTSRVSARITRNLAVTISHTYAYDSTSVESVRPADQRVQTAHRQPLKNSRGLR